MASGPITSWQIDGETVADFIFLGSKRMEEQRQRSGRWRGKGQVGESRAGREEQI